MEHTDDRVKSDFVRLLRAASQEVSIAADGYSRLPEPLASWADINRDGAAWEGAVVVMPLGRALILCGPDRATTSPRLSRWLAAGSSRIGPPLNKVLASHLIYPSVPIYRAVAPSERLADAARILADVEGSDKFARLTGKAYETLLREVLESVGVSVQQNLRVLGADVDLLLGVVRGDRPEFMIVECKHYARSNKKVGISQILRLFGLREALRKGDGFESAVIVSSTEVSPAARAFCTTYELGAYNMSAFLEWLAQTTATADERMPVFKVAKVDGRRRVRLPKALMQVLDADAPDSVVASKWVDRSVIVSTRNGFEDILKGIQESTFRQLPPKL